MNYLEKYKETSLTYTLMAMSIIMFILGQISPSLHEYFYMNGVLHGYSVVMEGELSRLVSSTFLHADAMHIVMNMLSLYIVGTMVEKLFSKTAYLSIYFIAAFVGSFTSIYMHLGGQAVGASGAIFGLFGALAGFAFVHRITMRDQFISFMKNFGLILVINLVIGFVFPSIDVSAHVGGLLAGMVGGFMIAKNPKYLWSYMLAMLLVLVFAHQYIHTLYAA
ncbi:MAG: FIG056164: rhomboid family serine protease [uncultured Sulfurovum sp.]|uniref:FIG056164: rhomboid family serine protease n=1 Tax=uncultured Sulfurovum sp. TaxID=269237 RepID=A0A6S6TLK2_9BACT|nr:MAG: FIG056164: rhomboid family serine protease [uncultured Sulfurovum sp.]